MVNWRITATTIYCDAVAAEVTLMVYRDGSTRCSGYQLHHNASHKVAEGKNSPPQRQLDCEGPGCSRAIQYRDKLFAEEAHPEASGSPKAEGN